MTDNKQDITDKVQAQFGTHATNYVTSKVHSTGRDFDIILTMAALKRTDRVLDIATGGGHTALKLAPFAAEVVATDITQPMLDAARAFIAPQADNVTFELADAESLPFEDGSFDVVTCRLAAHHFADIYKFVLESVRVLRPGGRLVVHDHVAPDDERAAEYVDAFETLRDPSHVDEYSEQEWRSAFMDAGLTVTDVDLTFTHDANFDAWVQRQNVPADAVERLKVMLHQAPDAVRAWVAPRAIGTPEATFTHRYIIITGKKG
jgi:ubiquinone/menaquinone biosynthesis C-methylase UbiE